MSGSRKSSSIISENKVNNKVLIMAGGYGISDYRLNSIENKVKKESIISSLEEDKKSLEIQKEVELNDEAIIRFKNDNNIEYSMWGYSTLDSNLRKNRPEKGTIVFITHQNAAIYIGEIFHVFKSQKLNEIWDGRKWDFKIALINVFKIFIPDSKDFETRSFDQLCANNTFSPNKLESKNIERLYKKGEGFRKIIVNQKRGNFQGSQYAQKEVKRSEYEFVSSEDVLDNFNRYCMKTHFECILGRV